MKAKIIKNQKYKISYISFLNHLINDTVEYEDIWLEDAKDLRCEICGKKTHKRLHMFHSLEAIHTWHYFGTTCIKKVNIKEI